MNARVLVAILIIVVGVILVATSKDSFAVRYLTGLVSLDVAARLARSQGSL
jgi:hypothetical protein